VGIRRTLFALVVTLLWGASPAYAVSGIGVATPTSNAAGARTDYVVSFNNGSALSGTQTITVTFPGGTTFGAWNGASVVVAGASVGSCSKPVAAAPLTSVCGLFSGRSIAAGAAVQITFGGIGNGAAGVGKTVTVATTTDAAATSSPFTLMDGQSVSSVSASNVTPSRAAGALTTYVVGFTTSSTGGMSQVAASEITVDFPSGTTFDAWNGAGVTVAGVSVGSCSKPVAAAPLTSVCGLFTGRAIAPSTAIQLTFNGVTNGAAGTAKPVSVTTTSDIAAAPAGVFDVIPGGSVTSPAVDISAPSAAAGAVTQYTVDFATSTTGALSADAGSQITVDFPSGTTFPSWNGASVISGGAAVGSCSKPVSATPLRSVCGLFTGRTIAPSTPVQLKFLGVTNGGEGTGKTLTVSTTSDLPGVVSSGFDVVAGHAVSQPGVVISAPSEAAGAQTSYVVSFSTSVTGGMSADAASKITVNFPSETSFGGWNGANVVVAGASVGSCSKPVAATPLTSTCGLFTGRAIAPSTAVQLTFNGVTSPATVGTDKTMAVATTSDLPPVTSRTFEVVAAHTVGPVAVTAATVAPSVTTDYVVSFSTSVTGALSADAASQIALSFPAGTSFGGWNGASVSVGGVAVGSCSKPVAAAPLTSSCGLFTGRTIAAGTAVQIVLHGVTNPSAVGPYALVASTTSDPQPVTSAAYASGPPATIDGGPSGTTEDPTPAFAFSSSQPGASFECRVDSAPFLPCTSPYQPASALSGGQHTFEVRAAGGQPVSRTFSVATVSQGGPTPTPTPTPAPSPTPVPTPTPVPGRSVVVAPVSGKVLVKRPGSNTFVEVDAAEGIPLGSTVDAKKGVILLTARAGQSAKFSQGIFKVTQSATTTDLTLAEPLAPCGKKANAAASKPKSRKLWGEGTGSFRTRGQYSAATIRGTKWLVQDSCSGTLTKVATGVVSVRDDVKRRTVLVKAGGSYLAKPGR
jgi:hypothetical protein